MHRPQSPGAGGDNVGAGRNAQDATARTGQGSLRAGLLREAWTHIGGDRVQGNKIVIQAAGDRGVVLRTLSASIVDTVRHAFREPPRWDAIRTDAWRQSRSVVLRGPGGAGKTAAAVRLLIAASAKTWFRLDSVDDLARLTDLKQIGSGAGLILDRPPDLGELRGPLLESLEDLLYRADAHLVLIAGTEDELGRGVGEYVQRVIRPEALNAVLEAHLAHHLGEAEAERVLEVDGVGELAAELLDDAACRDAARLAEVLAQEYGPGTLDPPQVLDLDLDRVRARMDQTGGEGPEEWFEGLGDTVLRTQAVALAVLGGLPQEEVALAASMLLDRFRSERGVLTPSVEQGPVPLRQDPFAHSRRLFADKLRSRTVSSVTQGSYGWLPCTVAEYRNPDYPSRIIRHVWSEYRVQPELIGWLAGLVDSPAQQVRGFAGTALGLIATESFEFIANQVFAGWIRHEESGSLRREAVAYALKVCARDPALRTGVYALVNEWYLSGTWQTQAAAARAYGLCLGGTDLGTAVAALTRLGMVDHIQVAIAIGDGFADMMAEDVTERAPVVLRAVAEMVHQPRSRACGHLVFLILADALVTEEVVAGAVPRSRPTLLWLAATGPSGGELRRLLGYLWAEAIGGELFAEEAARVLHGWAAQAESDPLLLDDLVRSLVGDVATRNPRVGLLLQRYVARWNERDSFRPLPRSAAVLGGALRQGRPDLSAQPGGAR
ncbi:hypothetical protein C6Y14_39995 [Streptomyces dioscori]|uniref:Uncharacterized protein n=1 Tax=Streptomyces dioscori TaxID=2109333 RepID=A0A2P8PUZ4_9ACTN|nr:hypothetical protein [Streptomyces dioscori]PSM37815.1 hypothetical protein C6Y14_39995 [Streptomyces dioscori]